MTKHKVPDGEDGQNPFAEILHVMDTEHLIRFRRRLEKIGRKRMVEILTDEIEERDIGERLEHAKEKVKPKKA